MEGDNDNEQGAVDQRDVNAQLVLSILREQELADRLCEQLAFTRAITGSLGEGVYALDANERITFVNPAAERLLGWTQAELLGKSEQAVIAFRRADDAGAGAAAPSGDHDLVCIRKDRATFPVSRTAAPIVIGGAQTGTVVAFRDMTEVRMLERAREEYVALISHDLRNPLTVIQGRVQLLLRHLQRQELSRASESAQTILANSKRMDSMLTDLLEQMRLESGNTDLHTEPTDLTWLLARIVAQFAADEESGRIALDDAPPLMVPLDPARIERVALNLLSNARKYSSGSPIVVHIDRDGNEAVVSVTDQGMGIAPADLTHLFEKYYRTELATVITGMGLGLYSSRLIVEAHGGRIWAESVVGEGSTFRFSLPLQGRTKD